MSRSREPSDLLRFTKIEPKIERNFPKRDRSIHLQNTLAFAMRRIGPKKNLPDPRKNYNPPHTRTRQPNQTIHSKLVQRGSCPSHQNKKSHKKAAMILGMLTVACMAIVGEIISCGALGAAAGFITLGQELYSLRDVKKPMSHPRSHK